MALKELRPIREEMMMIEAEEIEKDGETVKRGGIQTGSKTGPPSSFFFPLLSHCSIFTVSLILFLIHPCFPLLRVLLENPCIFNIAASSKLWTYSLAFKVLMKACSVLAPSLFRSTYSQLPSYSPTQPPHAYCTVYNTPHPANLSKTPLSSHLLLF